MRCADAGAEAERIAFGVSDLRLGCRLALSVFHSPPPFVIVITIRSSGVLSLKLVHLRVEAVKGVFGWLIVIVEVEVGFRPWGLGQVLLSIDERRVKHLSTLPIRALTQMLVHAPLKLKQLLVRLTLLEQYLVRSFGATVKVPI